MSRRPFRNDIVGSFLRPQRLVEARLSGKNLQSVEDECIRDLVDKQLAVGLKSVTDGEFRRSYWHTDFFWGFDGIEHVKMKQGYIFNDEETRNDSARCVSKISYSSHPFLSHFKFLSDVVDGRAQSRLTIPAFAQFLAELGREENEAYLKAVYPVEEDLHNDLISAYRGFIQDVYDLGCRNLQIDDCTWGLLVDDKFSKLLGDTQAIQELYVRLNNRVIEGWPEDLIINTHVCRGNYHSTWAMSGGYDKVSDVLFSQSKVNGFYLEFDDHRSGDFESLSKVGDDQYVVLGLVTSKHGELESKESIIERIHEASQFVDLDRLCLSPQCGFASTEEGNILTEEEQWDKLRLIKEISEEVWSN